MSSNVVRVFNLPLSVRGHLVQQFFHDLPIVEPDGVCFLRPGEVFVSFATPEYAWRAVLSNGRILMGYLVGVSLVLSIEHPSFQHLLRARSSRLVPINEAEANRLARFLERTFLSTWRGPNRYLSTGTHSMPLVRSWPEGGVIHEISTNFQVERIRQPTFNPEMNYSGIISYTRTLSARILNSIRPELIRRRHRGRRRGRGGRGNQQVGQHELGNRS